MRLTPQITNHRGKIKPISSRIPPECDPADRKTEHEMAHALLRTFGQLGVLDYAP